MKAKINYVNIKSYLVGNFRYRLYYSKFKWLIKNHIVEQIDWRTQVMDKQCYDQGSCILCGCPTIALQMSNKACDKPCYPTMMNKSDWFVFEHGGIVYDKETDFCWQMINKELIKFKTNTERNNELEKRK